MKKTQNLPNNCTSCRLNIHDQLGRLCVCERYKSTLRTLAKENTLVLIAVDTGGKNTEYDQIRAWAAPIAGPETSAVLQGILGKQGILWLPVRERTFTAETQEKHLLFLYFALLCSFFKIFFFFFLLLYLLILLTLWKLAKLWIFFSQSHFLLLS